MSKIVQLCLRPVARVASCTVSSTSPHNHPCKSFAQEDKNAKRKNRQWFKKKYCDDDFRDDVSAYYKKHITQEGGCETKDEETGDAGKACCTC